MNKIIKNEYKKIPYRYPSEKNLKKIIYKLFTKVGFGTIDTYK